MSARIFLIVGAPGKQGGGAVDALLARRDVTNMRVRALSRRPDSLAAKAFAARGVERVKGSLTDKASLLVALEGIPAAFLITVPTGSGETQAEEQEGKTFLDAARGTRLPFLVFSSVDGAERQTGVPFLGTKRALEEYLRASGIHHTIFRPVAFFDNFPKQSGMASFFLLGMFDAALRGKKLQLVACTDIGRFAAKALEEPEEFSGRTIGIAGESSR